MKWTHHDLVEKTISDFVRTHLPDAHDWEDGPYVITALDKEEGQVFRIEADIPTSAEDCWIMFEVASPALGADADTFFFQAIRSGVDGDDATYACTDPDGEWVITSDD